MKRCIAILFITIFVLSSTEAHQLLRVPYIFKHYIEHHRENNQISFLTFLDMHYMHGSPRGADYDEDMKLPFKSTDSCRLNFSVVFILPVNVPITIKPVELSTHIPIIFKDSFPVSEYHSGIWQPPKAC